MLAKLFAQSCAGEQIWMEDGPDLIQRCIYIGWKTVMYWMILLLGSEYNKAHSQVMKANWSYISPKILDL